MTPDAFLSSIVRDRRLPRCRSDMKRRVKHSRRRLGLAYSVNESTSKDPSLDDLLDSVTIGDLFTSLSLSWLEYSGDRFGERVSRV
ncbi:MAG: hypothetical protein INR71_15320, partial [Terriglobus roseus]|nr:hypothetical protein [Terriglobus roseus]